MADDAGDIAALLHKTQRQADDLGKQLTDIAAEAGVSDQTLYKWRQGQRVRPKNDRAISAAFGWEAGAQQAILNGEEPAPLEAPLTAAPAATTFDDPREQAIWQLPALTEDERVYLIGALRQRDQLLGTTRAG
jgi:transposase-like protein